MLTLKLFYYVKIPRVQSAETWKPRRLVVMQEVKHTTDQSESSIQERCEIFLYIRHDSEPMTSSNLTWACASSEQVDNVFMVSNMSQHFQFRHQSFLLHSLVLVCLMHKLTIWSTRLPTYSKMPHNWLILFCRDIHASFVITHPLTFLLLPEWTLPACWSHML